MEKFVLSSKYFEFSEKFFQQISGTAISTKFVPPYACLYMDEVETKFLQTQRFKPLVWLRLLIIYFSTHGEENLQNFMKELNNFKSNLKFIFECDNNSIDFLYLNVKLNHSCLYKHTDHHQYLHYGSSHPDNIKGSIIYSQVLWASRLCSFKEDFADHSEKMKIWFSKRGYPDKIIENEMKKKNFGESRSKTNSATGVPFVVTYHPRLKALIKVITHENLNLLYMNDEVKDTFTPKLRIPLRPMVSFRNFQKLSSYLVRAKLYPIERTVGSRKCSKNRCEVCENVQNSDTFKSSVTSQTFTINDPLTCDDKCLVYLFTCKTCSKQYTGETTDQFKWNNYKSESLRDENLVCKNIGMNIFIVMVIMVSLRMMQ